MDKHTSSKSGMKLSGNKYNKSGLALACLEASLGHASSVWVVCQRITFRDIFGILSSGMIQFTRGLHSVNIVLTSNLKDGTFEVDWYQQESPPSPESLKGIGNVLHLSSSIII